MTRRSAPDQPGAPDSSGATARVPSVAPLDRGYPRWRGVIAFVLAVVWRRRDEDGRVTAFVVVAAAGLLLVAGLVLDGGNALAARSRAIGIAEEAARSGCQQLDLAAYRAGRPLTLDVVAAEQATRAYLDAAGATGTVTTTPDEVTVTATVTTQPQLLGVLGIGAFTVTGIGAARPTPPT